MPLVCVCARPDGAGAGAAGAGAGGELEPLSETGGNVLVAPSGGTGCSVMTLARGNVPLDRGPVPVQTQAHLGGLRRHGSTSGSALRLQTKQFTGNVFLELDCQPKPLRLSPARPSPASAARYLARPERHIGCGVYVDGQVLGLVPGMEGLRATYRFVAPAGPAAPPASGDPGGTPGTVGTTGTGGISGSELAPRAANRVSSSPTAGPRPP